MRHPGVQGSISHLRGAITLGIIASALDSHVTQAIQSNWVMPVQLTKQDASSEGPTFHAMEVEGMWPYWMDGRDDSTVRNDLTLNSMVILTGECPSHRHVVLDGEQRCTSERWLSWLYELIALIALLHLYLLQKM
jgi:hypothetical protein